MAWRTRSGRTSNRELEAATRRGTEPRTGIRNRAEERAKLEASWARTERQLKAMREGDYSFFWED